MENFVKKRLYLFWSTKNFAGLSEEAVVEAVLAYGNWEDVQELINILGLSRVAAIFRGKAQAKRCNFRPEIKNYFELYFKKYA